MAAQVTPSAPPSRAGHGPAAKAGPNSSRITSIDAVRGLVVFTMIFVNDLAGVSDSVVPASMKHFRGQNGMTFVDLVFPAFLFIVGMSIPFALTSRLSKGQPIWNTLGHVVTRTLSLLFIGILMVNGTPDSGKMGWSGPLWSVLMYSCAILAFCSLSPRSSAGGGKRGEHAFALLSRAVRAVGLAALVFLAFAYRGRDGHRIISLAPFSIHTEWYGILGLIGWAYLVGCIVFLVFRANRTALLGCAVLLMCLYPADRAGLFEGFWLAKYVGIGATLGSHAAITVAGMLLASSLCSPDLVSAGARARFALWFIAGCAAAAVLLNGLYGINKNQATPSWCLWACAITAAVWLAIHLVSSFPPLGMPERLLAVAGQNVFLAYLLSDLFPSAINWLGLGGWYGSLGAPGLFYAFARSAGCAIVILCATAALNRVGFRLKL